MNVAIYFADKSSGRTAYSARFEKQRPKQEQASRNNMDFPEA